MSLPALFLAAALSAAVRPGPDSTPSDSVPLYDDLGSYHLAVTTKVAPAQAYFDQGLRLVYGFNHGEAIRAFTEATRLDPTCAMCYWGIAYAHGPHVNAGMDSAGGVAAWTAIQQAKKVAGKVTPREQDYINALVNRYAAVPPSDRASLDSAYSKAMGKLVAKYPNDLDAKTLYAESLMDLSPWNYWNKDRSPRPDTPTIIAQLEGVIAKNPNHPGACHYYIHAVEATEPAKAVPCAERLAALMPGAGHMVHMPGHIYIRVGRYNDAIMANEHAVHTDQTYMAEGKPGPGVYTIGYVPHNYHFLAFAATMAGRSKEAIDAAKKTSATTPFDVARAVPLAEPYVPYQFLSLTTFGHWDEILALPVPPADLSYSYGLAQYARGVAYAATGKKAEAQASLDSLVNARKTIKPEYATAGWSTPATVLQIAEHSLRGEIELRTGDPVAAVEHFKAAAAAEDDLKYIEPPDWYYPVRHSLGLALLKANRPAEAEAVYREDLVRFPNNGWALEGLVQSLKAQGKDTTEAAKQFQAAWSAADVQLTGSRF
jgi:tetratricopeptide (TPR) repeat protein